jgi:hypothetical protein
MATLQSLDARIVIVTQTEVRRTNLLVRRVAFRLKKRIYSYSNDVSVTVMQ